MKRSKNVFGYSLTTKYTIIRALTTMRTDENKSSYVVENHDGRKLFPKSLKGAKLCVENFDEYYKIFNRKKS